MVFYNFMPFNVTDLIWNFIGKYTSQNIESIFTIDQSKEN